MQDSLDTTNIIDANYPDYPLAELHAHLGTSIDPAVLWQIAHSLGVKLPKSEYSEFKEYITLTPDRPMALNEYFHKIYHPILDKLSSGTLAVEAAVYNTMSGAYRHGIQLIELRTNPMKHNFNAEVDLDHLIMAMLRGMERALLEHPNLSAGLVFCIAREYDVQRNTTIIEKAMKYHKRGVVGIDIAGPADPSFKIKDYASIFEQARGAGLGVTIHTGEVHETDDFWDALNYLNPTRIGHGILSAYDQNLMRELAARGTVLEICPMSNIVTEAVADLDEISRILRTLIDNNVKFCINTDWPETIEGGRLRHQYQLLRAHDILSEDELAEATRTAFAASFIKRAGLDAYL